MNIQLRGVILLTILLGIAGPLQVQAEPQLAAVELQAMADTFQYALENNRTRESSDWINPDNMRSGEVVPVRTFENERGQPCREFITTIIIAGQEEEGYGTACRQADGNWAIVSDAVEPPKPVARRYEYEPPVAYYAYPDGFFGSYPIYLSFGYVYRSGHRHSGKHYLDGHSFRNRYPIRVRQRSELGSQFFFRYRLSDELEYRAWDRGSRGHKNREIKHGYSSDKKWYQKHKTDHNNNHRKDDRGHD